MKHTTSLLFLAIGLSSSVMAQPAMIHSPTAGPDSVIALMAADDTSAVVDYDVWIALSTHHRNERHRLFAQLAFHEKRWNDAEQHFRIAAKLADKYSQYRLGVMYWYGIGVPQDRVQGYVWADLAAERGYPQFLLLRESMWKSLSPDEQKAVAPVGVPMYAQYGDSVAKPRFANELRISRKRWRTKLIAGLGVTGSGGIDAQWAWSQAYAEDNILPDKYWAKQDRMMRALKASVEVGELERTAPAKAEPKP